MKDRKVDADEAAEYARSQGEPNLPPSFVALAVLTIILQLITGLFYAETSAKADNNVEQLFAEVAKRVPKTSANVRKDVVNVKAAVPQAKTKGACC